MKNSNFRSAAILLTVFCALLCAILLSGCSAQKIGSKPGDDMNSSMSAQQKAVIAEHKKQADQ